MDWIHINGLRCYGYTGVLPEEQTLGQWFEVNLTLGVDLSKAGRSDRLEDTLDYRRTIATVQQIVQQQKFALIERLATAIAEAILQVPQDQQVAIHQVQVKLTKHPPIPDFGGSITVEITRCGLSAAPANSLNLPTR